MGLERASPGRDVKSGGFAFVMAGGLTSFALVKEWAVIWTGAAEGSRASLARLASGSNSALWLLKFPVASWGMRSDFLEFSSGRTPDEATSDEGPPGRSFGCRECAVGKFWLAAGEDPGAAEAWGLEVKVPVRDTLLWRSRNHDPNTKKATIKAAAKAHVRPGPDCASSIADIATNCLRESRAGSDCAVAGDGSFLVSELAATG